MNRPDFAFVHPVWKGLGPAETRVLLALALYRPNRLTNAAILNAYQPQKGGTPSLVADIVKRIQPAAATFGPVIVREGKGYRMVERPKEVRRAPLKAAAKAKPAPIPSETPVETVAPSPVEVVAPSVARPRRASKPAAEPAPIVEPEVMSVEDRIRDLAQRRFARSAIAATLRVPYRTVERVLGGAA